MENVRYARRAPRAVNRSLLKNSAAIAVYFACGVLITRGAVLGTLAPFGASFAASAPKNRLLPALLGTAFGYVLLSPTDSFRYLAVTAAIGGVRWLLGGLPKISSSRLFAPLTAFVPILATGAALLFSGTGTVSELSFVIIEAFLAAAAAYIFSSALRLLGGRKTISGFTKSEAACLVTSSCVLLLSLGSLAIEDVSVGRILAVTAVLLCARCGGVSGGAVSGVATGAVFSLSGFEQGFICGGYAFGGLAAGLFSGAPKIITAAVFTASDFLMSMAFGSGRLTAATLIEGVSGAAAFMLLPKSVEGFVSPLFAKNGGDGLGDALKSKITMRLDFISKAIGNVKNDVEKVSEKLGVMYNPSFEGVCEQAAKEVCSGCGLKMYCYEHKGGVTRDDFFRLEEPLSLKGAIDESDIEARFVKTCCKKAELAAGMTEGYRELLACREAERRVAEIRGVVAGQFSGIGDILGDLSRELDGTVSSDAEAADLIITRLRQIGLNPRACVCLMDSKKRMKVELTLGSDSAENIKRGVIAREISRCCGRSFDLPSVAREDGRIRLTLCEMPDFDVEIGTDQHIAYFGKLCGDCIDYFNEGGKTYAMICDGMGTGGRAAVDSNMAVSVMGRLLRAGLGEESSLQIVNSALMIKSEDESLSTVDLLTVDLYTGAARISKAGAHTTYIKKGGRVSALELRSLPAGILGNIKFATDSVRLSAGDMVVMVSDGVAAGDEKWLENLIKSWNRGSTQELAQAVVEEAIRRREGKKDDDITAVAVRLVDNETD